MSKRSLAVFTLLVPLLPFGVSAQDSTYEARLNTANTIRAAFELRRLAESLAPGIDTRCYIAKLAAHQASSLPQSANVIENYPSGNEQSDAFAIQSVSETIEIYEKNRVQEIADECKNSS